jgi:hypothetical protein
MHHKPDYGKMPASRINQPALCGFLFAGSRARGHLRSSAEINHRGSGRRDGDSASGEGVAVRLFRVTVVLTECRPRSAPPGRDGLAGPVRFALQIAIPKRSSDAACPVAIDQPATLRVYTSRTSQQLPRAAWGVQRSASQFSSMLCVKRMCRPMRRQGRRPVRTAS